MSDFTGSVKSELSVRDKYMKFIKAADELFSIIHGRWIPVYIDLVRESDEEKRGQALVLKDIGRNVVSLYGAMVNVDDSVIDKFWRDIDVAKAIATKKVMSELEEEEEEPRAGAESAAAEEPALKKKKSFVVREAIQEQRPDRYRKLENFCRQVLRSANRAPEKYIMTAPHSKDEVILSDICPDVSRIAVMTASQIKIDNGASISPEAVILADDRHDDTRGFQAFYTTVVERGFQSEQTLAAMRSMPNKVHQRAREEQTLLVGLLRTYLYVRSSDGDITKGWFVKQTL